MNSFQTNPSPARPVHPSCWSLPWRGLWCFFESAASSSTVIIVPWSTMYVCPRWMNLNEGSRALPPGKSLPFPCRKSCRLLRPLTTLCCSLEMGEWQQTKGLWNHLQLKAKKKILPTMLTCLFSHRKTKYLESVNACKMPPWVNSYINSLGIIILFLSVSQTSEAE